MAKGLERRIEKLRELAQTLVSREPSSEALALENELEWIAGELSDSHLELRQQNKELSHQRDFLGTLIETIPNPVYYKDRQGHYTGCNSAFERLIGKNRREILGRTASDLMPAEQARFFDAKDISLFEHMTPQQFEWTTEIAGLGSRDFIYHRAPIQYGEEKASGLICVISDITNRKEAERELTATNEQLEILLHSLPVGIVMIDYETFEIVDMNPQAMLIIGCTHEELIGRICTDHICPAQKGACPIVHGKQAVDRSEKEVITKSGKRVPVLKTVLPMEFMDRKILVECFVDITENRQAEEERLKKEKLMSIVEMAGAVCHEMNQPLQIITGYCELLETSGSDFDPAWIHEIAVSGRKLGNITRNLMGVTSYETKSYAGESKIIDLTRASGSSRE